MLRWIFKWSHYCVPAFLLVAGATGCSTAQSQPRNIILMICDGCGYNHVDATSLFEYGQTGVQVYEQFPVTYAMSTYPVGCGYDPEKFWSDFHYCIRNTTDSAAAITAMSSGVKTRNGTLCIDADGRPLPTLCERMAESGRATGVVTTVQFAHATPAGLVIRNPHRNQYEAISRDMILDSRVDVIMGAGHPLYDRRGKPADRPRYRYVGGRNIWETLVAGNAGGDIDGDGVADPWTLIQDRADFQALMTGPTPKRVIGVPRIHETLQQERRGDADAAPFSVPFIAAMPTLTEMSRAAINVLDDDPQGFFLMIEGGAVDWASHDNQSGRMIEEQIDFNHGVTAVVAWIENHGGWEQTLLIVTGDHETGFLAGPPPDSGEDPPCPLSNSLLNHGQGNLPEIHWYAQGHTNSLIPLYAKGAGSELFHAYADEIDPVRGRYLDNSELGKLLCLLSRN